MAHTYKQDYESRAKPIYKDKILWFLVKTIMNARLD